MEQSISTAATLSLGSNSVLRAIGGNRVSTSYRGGGGSGGRIALKSTSAFSLAGTIQYYGRRRLRNINKLCIRRCRNIIYERRQRRKTLYYRNGQYREETVIDDSLEPMNLALLSLNTAEVEVTSLTDCDELQAVNADLIMNPASSLNIDTVSITLNSSSLAHRRCTFGSGMSLGDVTLQGYNTSRHAELELINGSDITSSFSN